MTAAQPLSDLARAEFEARLEAARRRLPEAEATALTSARPDYGIALVANYSGQIASWSRQLGHPRSEWYPALEKCADWLIRRIEWIDASGPPYRRDARDWRGALQTAIATGNRKIEQRVLGLQVNTEDGSLGPATRPYTEGLLALATGDEYALAAAAAELSRVLDEEVIKSQWYPRLGPALQALYDHDADTLRTELDVVCAQHVAFSKRGHLRLSEGAWMISPVLNLLILARRRGLAVDVDPKYHAQRMRLRPSGYLTEWEGQPVDRNTIVEAIVDPVPIDELG